MHAHLRTVSSRAGCTLLGTGHRYVPERPLSMMPAPGTVNYDCKPSSQAFRVVCTLHRNFNIVPPHTQAYTLLCISLEISPLGSFTLSSLNCYEGFPTILQDVSQPISITL